MKKKNKKSKSAPRQTYDDGKRKQIVAYLRGHTNEEVKAKFGCSAHFAGSLRAKHKIPSVTGTRSGGGKKSKPTAKKSKGKKSKRGGANSLL